VLTCGVPLRVISDILGHSSIAVTGDIYGHVSRDVARQAVDTLSDVDR
jgi:integrase